MKLIELLEVKMSPKITTNQPNINEVLVGFEVECILDIEKTTKLKAAQQLLDEGEDAYLEAIDANSNDILSAIHSEIEEQISPFFAEHVIRNVVADSSIHGFAFGEVPAEIITNPLPYDQSINILQELLALLQSKYNMRTLNCCSLHVNISCEGTRNETIDLMKLVAFLDSDHFLKMFDRTKNKYTRSINTIFNILSPSDFANPTNNTLQKLTNNKEQLFEFITKYFSINVNKLQLGYLEVRIIGGDNYHLKIKQILLSISHFVHAILIASGDGHQQEYLTKLTKLIQRFRQRELYAKSIWKPEEQLILSLIFKKYPYLNNDFIGYSELKEIIKLHFKPEMLKELSPLKQKQILQYIQDNFLYRRSIKTKTDIDFLIHLMEKIGVPEIEHLYDCEYLNIDHVVRALVEYTEESRIHNKYAVMSSIVHILSASEIQRMVGILLDCSKKTQSSSLQRLIKSFVVNMNKYVSITHYESSKQVDTGRNDQ